MSEKTTNSVGVQLFWRRFFNGTPCDRLHFTADLIPSPGLRKRVSKMLADQEHQIYELREQGRWADAKRVFWSTCMVFAWMVLASPFSALHKYAVLGRGNGVDRG